MLTESLWVRSAEIYFGYFLRILIFYLWKSRAISIISVKKYIGDKNLKLRKNILKLLKLEVRNLQVDICKFVILFMVLHKQK